MLAMGMPLRSRFSLVMVPQDLSPFVLACKPAPRQPAPVWHLVSDLPGTAAIGIWLSCDMFATGLLDELKFFVSADEYSPKLELAEYDRHW